MNPLEPWWLLPAALFVVPLIAGLVYNAAYKHRFGVSMHATIALFVFACWIAATVIILRAVQH
ncbi:MAG: hypothetical protein QM761_10810 [Pseudoxanthomonas sp.]